MRFFRALLLTALVATSPLLAAQSAPAPAPAVEKQAKTYTTYMLTYNVYEVENGKRVNTRTHKIVMSDNGQSAESRSEQRIPLSASTPSDFVSTGITIRSRMQHTDGGPLLSTDINMEYLVEEGSANGRPVLHKAEASANGSFKLDKPMLLAAIEDQQSKRSFQIEVTVTKQ